jgi:hypothetical protein
MSPSDGLNIGRRKMFLPLPEMDPQFPAFPSRSQAITDWAHLYLREHTCRLLLVVTVFLIVLWKQVFGTYVGNVAMLNCANKDCRYMTVNFILHVASESLMHISKLQRILTEMLVLQFSLTQCALPVFITFSISLY